MVRRDALMAVLYSRASPSGVIMCTPMFSSRFSWDFRPNRLTLALNARRAAGACVLDLTESNPTHAGLTYPPEIVSSLADGNILVYEPSAGGSPAAREAVSRYYR